MDDWNDPSYIEEQKQALKEFEAKQKQIKQNSRKKKKKKSKKKKGQTAGEALDHDDDGQDPGNSIQQASEAGDYDDEDEPDQINSNVIQHEALQAPGMETYVTHNSNYPLVTGGSGSEIQGSDIQSSVNSPDKRLLNH